MTAGQGHALVLSEAEIARYELMAEQARSAEVQTWATAGIVGGARVARRRPRAWRDAAGDGRDGRAGPVRCSGSAELLRGAGVEVVSYDG